jgi:hypothetical protein
MVGAYTSTDLPRPEQLQDAVSTLNIMLKAWSVEGFLWLRNFATVILNGGTNSYTLGPAGHVVTAYTTTTLAADVVAGLGAVTLTAGHGLTTSTTAWVGIRTADVVQWFQGYVIAGNLLTFTVPQVLATDVLSGDTVYCHTNAAIINRPTHVFTANRKNSSGSEVPMISLTRYDWMAIPNKTNTSTPVQFYYDPTTINGTLLVWPTPSLLTTDVLVVDVDRQLDIMNDNLNDFDFPPQWLECITYNLAARIAPEYGLPLGERVQIEKEAGAMLMQLSTDDRDLGSVRFEVRL